MARLDVFMVEKGICSSRERAKAYILAGEVMVNGKAVTKPAFMVSDSDSVELSKSSKSFFSRGEAKLQKAIDEFGLDFNGTLVLDVGASTGGFTHCALKNGARYVWAVDVGTNQLDSSLRNDSRVCSMEQTDIRTLSPDVLGVRVDIIVADLSFISLTQVARYMVQFIKPDGFMVLLIKPQFEVGKTNVGKNGIVKSSKEHVRSIDNVAQCFAHYNFFLNRITFAPLKGKGYNIEYLGLFSQKREFASDVTQLVDNVFILNRSV